VVLVIVAAVGGGIANPVYSLLVAYTNDFLDSSDMASASAGLLFINGLGAITGPLTTGWLMEVVGPFGFFLYLGVLNALIAVYAAWRMTRRPSMDSSETGAFAVLSPSASPIAVEAVLEAAQEEAHSAEEAALEAEGAANAAAAADADAGSSAGSSAQTDETHADETQSGEPPRAG